MFRQRCITGEGGEHLLALARRGTRGVLFFMIKQKNLRVKIRCIEH